ncbi:CubicO group peptidase (beta-lactamase class C family) [Chitinophaga skermanii]|uniref:CubicO group peptidase (Beta-lactamase class C family) n=1 Tax=Chitinophaga skermanii TaxID=331697 RepID=A0A327QZ93_9BACT|nr:serine hydrolase domain-containing protein [Chitinophaga skermanii]RAJ06987.1 CubicO group peptidase (beta-lactamase class C family) [Chitinophaga skermanii]
MKRLNAAFVLILPAITFFYACNNTQAKRRTNATTTQEEDTTYKINLTAEQRTAILNAPKTRVMQEELTNFFNKKLVPSGFSGAMLVAKKGVVIFEGSHGFENYQAKTKMVDTSTFQLASTSKTFTGVAVLKLVDEKKVNLDDSIQTYLPTVPYKGITVRMLLNHRSGLPNYLYFTEKYWKDRTKLMTNDDVIALMAQYKPQIQSLPNTRFTYCNTNYILLASIIEKASGMKYADFMQQEIFNPLGLTRTYVFVPGQAARSHQTTSHQFNGRPAADDAFDGAMGDKGIYSCVQDMLKWDQALYSGRFLSDEILKEAFTPYSNEKRGTKNYGLGFRLMVFPDSTKIVYHNGWWHGNNTVFYRFIQDSTTLVILGNKYNRNIYHSVKPIREIIGEGLELEAGED